MIRTVDLKRAEARAERGEKFKHFWQVNLAMRGALSANEWMAKHIGILCEQVDDLTRRLEQLERKPRKRPVKMP